MRLPCFISYESELSYAARWRCVDKLFMEEENCEDTVFAIIRELACQHYAPLNCLQRKRANWEGTAVAWERACQVCAQCWHWERIHGWTVYKQMNHLQRKRNGQVLSQNGTQLCQLWVQRQLCRRLIADCHRLDKTGILHSDRRLISKKAYVLSIIKSSVTEQCR